MTATLAALAVLFYSISTIYYSIKFFLKKEKARHLAFLALILGLVIHGLNLLVFSFEHHRFPAANVAEALSLLSWVIVLLFVWIIRKDEMDSMGVVLLPLAVIFIIFNSLMGHETGKGIEPVMSGGWIYVHIPLMILSMASLFLTFVVSVMYLLQERQLKSKHPAFLYSRLPSLEVCEDLAYKGLWIGFLLLTLGIITGMIWSRYRREVYWSWDYKEIWAVITWALYAVLLHGRMLSSWRGRKAAYLAIVGFAFLLFAFVGVSLVLQTYHSF